MKQPLALALFLLLVVGGGLVIGFLTAPGAWYAGLAKPSFTPPAWVFAPVWTLLYVAIAIAGWLVWRDGGGASAALWWTQLALNFAWSPTFFAAHETGLAFAIILLLLATIVAFIAATRRQLPVAAWLFLPYALWVAFAAVLNGTIWALN